jgi:hypothetical protein
MAINLHDRDRRAEHHSAYIADPGFPSLEAQANQRGYRKATLSEIHASAERTSWAPDLYCWCGGLWVKK